MPVPSCSRKDQLFHIFIYLFLLCLQFIHKYIVTMYFKNIFCFIFKLTKDKLQ